MTEQEILYKQSISKRHLPVNLDRADLRLFEHELSKNIPATRLLHFKDITVNPDGILFRKGEALPESFASPKYIYPQSDFKTKLKLFLKNRVFGDIEKIDSDAIWVTDDWSRGYFHWMTDALPRLFTIGEKLGGAVLLLPGAYQKENFIAPSIKPLFGGAIKFVNNPVISRALYLPTHTAPTGNYNEIIISDFRKVFRDFYENTKDENCGERIYVSRNKARWSKIVNEAELCSVLEEYNFKVVCFEDYSFESQIKIASEARFLISNHGASLTNMLFMKSGYNVLEFRRKNDAHNNCYFSLASALNLKYFYQICDTKNLDERANTADLIVDLNLLRKNIEQMFSKDDSDEIANEPN